MNIEIGLPVALATIIIAALSGFRLWAFRRRSLIQRQRLEAYRGPPVIDIQAEETRWDRRLGQWVAETPIIGVVEQQRLLKLLGAAGIKGQGSLARFLAIKVLVAALCAGLAWLLLEWKHLFVGLPIARLAAFSAMLLFGWRIPDMVLNRLVKRRRVRLEHGFPDALDLLVVCAEAGLSLNQAIEEISRQLRHSHKDVAEEFDVTSAEMRILSDIGQALDNLVARTGMTHLASLVATLKQSLKFGTPLAESLRIIAGEMRAERHTRIEERAARLPVLLAIPMMGFILPCLLMIVGTPVALRIFDAFKNISFGAP
jgi:tight adherence protein C